MTSQPEFTLQVHDSLAAIGREAWDACAAPTGDPFVSFDFLNACEASGSAVASGGTGFSSSGGRIPAYSP